MRLARILLALLPTAVALFAQPEAEPIRWIGFPNPQFEVNGLPWFEQNESQLVRLPLRLKESFRKPVWDLAQSPSGGRIRFRTDSTLLAIRLEYPSPPEMRNLHAFGQTGVDLYVDGTYRGTATAEKDSGPGKPVTHTYYQGKARALREVVLYLSLYKSVKVLEIGLDNTAKVEKASPFAAAKPVVFYGTSITQGGCASRSGLSYQAILGRRLNLDFVNLGFSGNGIGEPEMAKAVAEIDAACFVLDFAQNNRTVESLSKAYAPFLETVRAKHPETPVLVVTPIYSVYESWDAPRIIEPERMREHIRQVAGQRIAAGDRKIQIIEGTDLLGPSQGDGLVDGVHPNDLGFQWMAEGLSARLRKVLELK